MSFKPFLAAAASFAAAIAVFALLYAFAKPPGMPESGAMEPLNNGGMFVEYGDNVYYWECSGDSWERESLNMRAFSPVRETVNRLTKLKPGGAKTVLYEGAGSGGISIIGDRAYFELFELIGDDWIVAIHSITLGGGGPVRLGDGEILGTDGRRLIFSRSGNREIWAYDSRSNESLSICEGLNELTFIAAEDETIYYAELKKTEDGFKQLFRSVSIYGDSSKILFEPPAVEGAPVIRAQIYGESIFSSYGYYGGSEGLYNGGVILMFDKHTGKGGIVAGKSEAFTSGSLPVDQAFYLRKEKEATFLYWHESGLKLEKWSWDNPAVRMNILTGETSRAKFIAEGVNRPFIVDGKYYVYLDDSGEMVPLIDANGENGLNTVLAIAGDWVYFKDEEVNRKPEDDIGWREMYERQYADICRTNIVSGETETLFEY
ncbi:MAG: hypothetical protein LBT59_31065 [Clostridiales bacterium]|nr:hypothetical protein [Clostridiales bacterium]